MKRYYVMVTIRSNDPECCYDTFTTKYDGVPYSQKGRAEAVARKVERSVSRVVNAWVEEKEVTG